MANFAPVRLSLAALLLAKTCYGQDTASDDVDTSTTTAEEDQIFSAVATPVEFEAGDFTTMELAAEATALSNYPPGEYTINDSVYIVACESPTTEDGLSPFAISLIAAAITDFGDCIAFCDQLEDVCDVAQWDVTKEHPCVLLTSLTDGDDTTYGRCYAQKSPTADIDPILSSTDSPDPEPTPSELPSPSSSSRPYPPGIRSSTPSLPSPPFTDLSRSTRSSGSFSRPPRPTTYPGPRPSRSSRSSSTPFAPSPSSDQPTRRDAYCGIDHGEIPLTSCPQSDPVWGRCCSRFGFCGSSAQYCGNGCQADFGSCDGDDGGDDEPVTDFPFPSSIFRPSMARPEPVGTLVAKACDGCNRAAKAE
ncbi:Chitin-binding type 1 [Neofusicoccum parvum]|nr:Chitin-binding type 1 [Neofusicoccum parvum]